MRGAGGPSFLPHNKKSCRRADFLAAILGQGGGRVRVPLLQACPAQTSPEPRSTLYKDPCTVGLCVAVLCTLPVRVPPSFHDLSRAPVSDVLYILLLSPLPAPQDPSINGCTAIGTARNVASFKGAGGDWAGSKGLAQPVLPLQPSPARTV